MKEVEDPWRQCFPALACVLIIYFFDFFSPPTSPSLSLFLFTLLNPVSSPGTRSRPLFPNQTHPSGGGLSFSVSVTSGEGKANLMTPHKQWLLGPNRCRHYPSSLSHSSLISHSVIIFVLVCRCLTHPAQRNSASGLHLFAQLFLFLFFVSLSFIHTYDYVPGFIFHPDVLRFLIVWLQG